MIDIPENNPEYLEETTFVMPTPLKAYQISLTTGVTQTVIAHDEAQAMCVAKEKFGALYGASMFLGDMVILLEKNPASGQ